MPATKKTLDYRNKMVLAPMVRIGTLPTRLVALDNGADIVYSEEIIDLKMLRCTRVENAILGTVDFVMNDETVAFRTCPQERDRVVFQIGTADAKRALKVARMIENDVAAIDVNMGCPKEYSTKGGMGAALLSEPEKVKDILTTLVNALSIPVTCKIRLLPTLEETIEFVQMIETTGVAAIAVHGRNRDGRPRHPNNNGWIKAVAESTKLPVIANGGSKLEIKTYEDIQKFRESCGASSVMIARAAQWNPSIFRAAGLVPIHDIVKAYLKYSIDYQNTPTNMKYNMQQLLVNEMESPHGRALLAAGTVHEICSIWNLEKYYEEQVEKWDKHKVEQKLVPVPKKRTMEDGTEMWEMEFRYYKRDYNDNITPKYMLDQWIRKSEKGRPLYETEENAAEQQFYSVLTVEGVKYASTIWDKSKKGAEQSAAAVFLHIHDLPDGRKEWNSSEKGDSQSGTNNSEGSKAEEKPASSSSEQLTAIKQETTAGDNATQSTSSESVSKDTATVVDQDQDQNKDDKGSEALVVPKIKLEEHGDQVGHHGEGKTATGGASNMPDFSMAGKEGHKRSASMTQLIDDIIEKQIRLSQEEADLEPPSMNCSLVDNFVRKEMQADSEVFRKPAQSSSQKNAEK